MRPRRLQQLLAALTVLSLAVSSHACGTYIPGDLTSDDPAERQLAIDAYREMGPAMLHHLISSTYRERLAPLLSGEKREIDNSMRRLLDGIDAIAQQKDAAFAGLYWHTDLDQAKALAAEQGKPILALHLLGKLTDERSCANSRFFRAALYPDPEVQQALRDHYVLYWETVRTVPTLSIDMGDGRRIERTITGNSVHYILDPEGQVLDAIPGLVSPKAFLTSLQSAYDLHHELASRDQNDRDQHRRNTLARLNRETDQRWQLDLQTLIGGNALSQTRLSPFAVANEQPASRNVVAAQAVTVGKREVEMPVVKASIDASHWLSASNTDHQAFFDEASEAFDQLAMRAQGATRSKALVEAPVMRAGLLAVNNRGYFLMADQRKEETNHPDLPARYWQIVAQLHRDEVRLSPASRSLIRLHAATSPQPEHIDADQLIADFEAALAVDTAQNIYGLQRELRQWLVDANQATVMADLNPRVYAELFHTPLDDPWMGMALEDVYTGLPGGGLVTTPANDKDASASR